MKKLSWPRILYFAAAFCLLTVVQSVVTESGRAQVYQSMAECHWMLGNFEEAEDCLLSELAILESLDPKSPEYATGCEQYGMLLAEKKDWQNAQYYLKQARDLAEEESPEWIQRSRFLAYSMAKIGQYSNAEEITRHALLLAETNGMSTTQTHLEHLLGSLYLQQGEIEMAGQVLERAIDGLKSTPKSQSDLATAQQSYAVVLMRLGSEEEAATILQEVSENRDLTASIRAPAFHSLGCLQIQADSPGSAEYSLREALSLYTAERAEEEIVAVSTELSKILVKEKRNKEAEELLCSTVLTVGSPQSRYELARFLTLHKKDAPAAQREVRKALGNDSITPDLHARLEDILGTSYLIENRPLDAIGAFRKSLRIYHLTGDMQSAAAASAHLSECHHLRGDTTAAQTCAEEGLEMLRDCPLSTDKWETELALKTALTLG